MKSRAKVNAKIVRIATRIPCVPFLYTQYKRMRGRLAFEQDAREFGWQNDGRFALRRSDFSPCLLDNTEHTSFEPHYAYHPAWAARILAKTKPTRHVDFSSYLPFNTLVSAFVPIDFYDYRPALIKLDNLTAHHGDLCAIDLPSNSVTSLSCMHTIEHVGLGRYGDPIDPTGDLKAIAELKRILAPSGDLLLVVPIGRPKLLFNANRIYGYAQIMSYFSDLVLQEFTLIPDNAVEVGMIAGATQELADTQESGCGCFWFKKA